MDVKNKADRDAYNADHADAYAAAEEDITEIRIEITEYEDKMVTESFSNADAELREYLDEIDPEE